MAHGKGPHGKAGRSARKSRRARCWLRGEARKDRNVRRSSHGVFADRAALAAGRRTAVKEKAT